MAHLVWYVGVAIANDNIEADVTSEALIHRAETAMYAPKRDGKDRYVLYSAHDGGDKSSVATAGGYLPPHIRLSVRVFAC